MRRLNYISKVLGFLPSEIPGKARLARRLIGSSPKARNILVNGRDGATFLVPSLLDPIGFYLLVDGVYEPKAINFALEHLEPGSVFIDIGANIGVFTIPAALKVGPTGCVIAIEPSPRVFPYLQHNVSLNGLSNVRSIQCAAFNSDKQTVSQNFSYEVSHLRVHATGSANRTSVVTALKTPPRVSPNLLARSWRCQEERIIAC